MSNLKYVNLSKSTRSTQNSEEKVIIHGLKMLKKETVSSVQPIKISTKSLVVQSQAKGQNNMVKTRKYQLSDAQSSEQLEKCLEIFFNQSKAQVKNKNSSQGQYPQYNDIKGGSRDEKLDTLREFYTKFPFKYLLYVWSDLQGDIPKILQFLQVYSQRFNEPQARIQEQPPQKILDMQQQENWTNVPINQKSRPPKKRKKTPEQQYWYLRQMIKEVYSQKSKKNKLAQSIRNKTSKDRLQHEVKQLNFQIDELSSKSIKLLGQTIPTSGHLSVDIHGYTRAQCPLLLRSLHQMILTLQQEKNSLIKRNKKIDKDFYAKLTIYTGSGLHSEGLQSVLKEEIEDLCEEYRYPNEIFSKGIHVYFRIKLN